MTAADVRHVEIAIAGAGLSGLGMAIALRREGHDDFVVLERASDLGGTWRDNSYPGCACDIPSVLYSYADEPNPNWTRAYASQPEIWAYMRAVAARHDVASHMLYDHEVLAADWDETAQRWRIETAQGSVHRRHPHLGDRRAGRSRRSPGSAGPGRLLRPRVSLGPLGSRPRPAGPPRRGRRHGRLGDPVRPRDPAGRRPSRRLPAHPAVGPAARQPGHPGTLAQPVSPAPPRARAGAPRRVLRCTRPPMSASAIPGRCG